MDLGGLVERRSVRGADLLEQLWVDPRLLDLELLLAGLLTQLLERAADPLDLLMGDVQRVEDLGLRDAVGAALDHQDRVLRSRDDEVHLQIVVRLLARVDHEVAVELADPDRPDVREHGNRRDGDRGRGTVHGQDVVRVVVVDRHRLADDLGLVMPAVREQRPQRPIDHPGRQRRLLARPPLAPEEGAGDLPGCVVALLDVHGKRQEVDVPQVAGGRGGEDHRVARTHHDGAARLAGELAGLEGDLLAANLHRDAAHVKHAHVSRSLRPPGWRPFAQK